VGDKVFGERTRTRLLARLYVFVPLRENDYFQYDYILCKNDYISVNDYFPEARTTTSA
jgi:hypothetical protein